MMLQYSYCIHLNTNDIRIAMLFQEINKRYYIIGIDLLTKFPSEINLKH